MNATTWLGTGRCQAVSNLHYQSERPSLDSLYSYLHTAFGGDGWGGPGTRELII